MDRDLYSAGLAIAYLTADHIRNDVALPLEEMRRAIEHAEAVGPITDPTAWIHGHKRMEQDKRVVEILARAQRELNALPWPERVAEVAS